MTGQVTVQSGPGAKAVPFEGCARFVCFSRPLDCLPEGYLVKILQRLSVNKQASTYHVTGGAGLQAERHTVVFIKQHHTEMIKVVQGRQKGRINGPAVTDASCRSSARCAGKAICALVCRTYSVHKCGGSLPKISIPKRRYHGVPVCCCAVSALSCSCNAPSRYSFSGKDAESSAYV